MTQEAFIKVLKKELTQLLSELKYSYKMSGDKIIVTSKGQVNLQSLTSLPPDVEFRNGGGVYFNSLTSLPPGVEFRNGENVGFGSLTSLPPSVEFRNRGDVELKYLTSIPPGVEFKNGGNIYLRSLVGGWFSDWKGNIEGIESNRLLNVMIKQRVFER